MYASETWSLTSAEQHLLGVWERRLLRRIYGPVCENGQWRIRNNAEIQILFGEADLVTRVKQARLRWAGHLMRMDRSRGPRMALEGKHGGRRHRGRPPNRWIDQVEEDLRAMGVRRWRAGAQEREEWQRIVVEALVLLRTVEP
ncbi:uncharacterized protein [Rhodnius prolixus]|uniref:uncharacterized protein n=1 Tax=Rhodnius prolixus TaxID=13249 RepID=UPI003D18C284